MLITLLAVSAVFLIVVCLADWSTERDDRESARCPYCGVTFYAPAGHDPLRKHFDYCTDWKDER